MAIKTWRQNPKGDGMKPQTNAAILCRVSGRDQVKEGHSLEQQEEICRVYAKRNNMAVVKIYSAQESSLQTERVEQSKALADAESGLYQVLIVQDISRFTSQMLNGLRAVERLNNAGVTLHSAVYGHIDIETPQGQFMFATLAGARGVHLKDHINSSVLGRARIMREKKRPAAGRPPWGRTWNNKAACYKVVPNARLKLEQAHKAIAINGISLNQTAKKFGMAQSSLRKAIDQSTLTEVTQHLGGKEFLFKCEPILSERQQRSILQAISSNAVVKPRTKGLYLLQGLVRCKACGATMTGQPGYKGSGKHKRRYLVYRHPPRPRYKEGCTWQVPVELLNEDILYSCSLAISNGAQLQAAIENELNQKQANSHKLRERKKFIAEEIRQTGALLDRTLDRLVAFDEGSESRNRLEERAKAYELKLPGLRVELDEADRQLSLIQLPDETADAVAAKIRSLYWHGVGNKALSFEQQRDFVRTMVGRIGQKSEHGIFVTMVRAKGASKKDVSWRYNIQGNLMLAYNRINHGISMKPEQELTRQEATQDIRRLAQIAAASPGIKPPQRPYPSQMIGNMQARKKSSSDD